MFERSEKSNEAKWDWVVLHDMALTWPCKLNDIATRSTEADVHLMNLYVIWKSVCSSAIYALYLRKAVSDYKPFQSCPIILAKQKLSLQFFAWKHWSMAMSSWTCWHDVKDNYHLVRCSIRMNMRLSSSLTEQHILRNHVGLVRVWCWTLNVEALWIQGILSSVEWACLYRGDDRSTSKLQLGMVQSLEKQDSVCEAGMSPCWLMNSRLLLRQPSLGDSLLRRSGQLTTYWNLYS